MHERLLITVSAFMSGIFASLAALAEHLQASDEMDLRIPVPLLMVRTIRQAFPISLGSCLWGRHIWRPNNKRLEWIYVSRARQKVRHSGANGALNSVG